MAKKEVNKIEREKFVQIISEVDGLETKDQTAYTKITAPGRRGKVYLAKSTKVTRVDLTALGLTHEAIVNHTPEDAKALKLGKVDAQLDFSKDEAQVLEAFRLSLEALKTSEEEKAKAPPAPTPEETAEQAATEQAAAGTAE